MDMFDNNITEEFRKLLALNGSLTARVEECTDIIRRRDAEIEMLQAMVTESGAHRSNLDSDVARFKSLQEGFKELQQQVAASAYIGTHRITPSAQGESLESKLADLRLQYTYLQTQVTDLQKQIQELTNKNLQLQQEASRFALMESQLESAEEEIRELRKNKSTGPSIPPFL